MLYRTLAVSVLTAGLAFAAPAGAMSDGEQVKLDDVERLIQSEKYDDAVMKLQDYTEASPFDADGYNLLGYSQRQLGAYDEAKSAYDRALRLDPAHKGAMEYLGELYLQTGKPEEAKAMLGKLEEACGTDCPEYRQLSEAIASHQ